MKSSMILRNALIAVLFSILFVPLVFSGNMFFPYIAGKNFTFRGLVEVAGLLYVFLVILDRSYWPKRSVVIASLLSFLAVMGIATLTSQYPYKSFWSNFERMEGYITVLHLFVYAFVMVAVFNTEKLWEWFFETSLFASLIVGVNALFDLQHGIDRIYGTLGNSTYLGVYALVHIFIAGFLLFKLIEKRKQHTTSYWLSFSKYIVYMLFDAYIMYQTGTRGSFAGLLAGLVLIALLIALFEKKRKTLRKVSIGVFVAIVAAVVILGATKNVPVVKNSLLGRYAALITPNVESVLQTQGEGRLLIWNVAWQGVKERPILGWGQESFNYVFNKYYTPDLWAQEQWFDRAHNVFLDWLIAGGILGLLTYLSLYVALLWSVWKAPEETMGVPGKAIITGLVAAYFVHNLFVFDNLASYIIFFALIAYTHHLVTPQRTEDAPISMQARYAVGILASLAFLYVFYIGIVKPVEANTDLLQALQYQSEFTEQGSPLYNDDSALTYAYEDFDKALSYNTFGTPEIREQLALSGESTFQSADPTLKATVMARVDSEFAKQLEATPLDARYYSIYGSYLSQTGQYQKALVNIREAEVLSPGKQTFRFDEGIALIGEASYGDAFTVLQSAYNMATSNPTAVLMYATGAVYDKQMSVFNTLLAANPDLIANTEIIQAFIVSKQPALLIAPLGAYIATHQGLSPEIGLYLADAYLESGNRAASLALLEQIQKSAAANPQASSALQYYIDQENKGAKNLFQQQ